MICDTFTWCMRPAIDLREVGTDSGGDAHVRLLVPPTFRLPYVVCTTTLTVLAFWFASTITWGAPGAEATWPPVTVTR